MHTYKVVLKDDDGKTLEDFRIGALNMRYALEISASSLLRRDRFSGAAAEATIEILGNYTTDPDTGARVFTTDADLLVSLGIEATLTRADKAWCDSGLDHGGA